MRQHAVENISSSKINSKNSELIDASIKRIMKIYGLVTLFLFTEK